MDIIFNCTETNLGFMYAHESAHFVIHLHPFSLFPSRCDDFDIPSFCGPSEEELALYRAILFQGFYGTECDGLELQRLFDEINAAKRAEKLGRIVLCLSRRRQLILAIYKSFKFDLEGLDAPVCRWWSPHVSPKGDEEDASGRFNCGCYVQSLTCSFGHPKWWKSSLVRAKSSKHSMKSVI